MRGIRDTHDFVSQLSAKITKELQNEYLVLRNQVVVNPTPLGELEFSLMRFSLQDLIVLCVARHYMNEEANWAIHFEIERVARKFNPEDRCLISLLNNNPKGYSLLWLIETSIWSTNSFFGNILPNALKKINAIKRKRQKTIVKRPQRKRGYHDKGSRAKDPYWKYARNRGEDAEIQEQLYQRRQTEEDTRLFLGGMLE
jgi:hypothetical protein